MSPDSSREDVAERLRETLRAADREMGLPPGLWDRISTAPRPVARPARRLSSRLLAAGALTAAACAVAAVALGVWWLTRPGAPDTAAPAVSLTVHNAEAPCRPLRTLECALRLARDPHARYSADGNSAGRVWHGDRVAAVCVVTDGRLVEDESGITSTRWYLVTTGGGARGWLPGVRTRNTEEVRLCTPEETGSETTRFTP